MDNGFVFIHEVWTPKIKWFRPPMIALFRWAYNIDITMFTDCRPARIPLDSKEPGYVDIEFTVSGYDNLEINKKVEEMYKK